MYNNLAVLAIFAFLYSAVAGRIERSWLSGPIIFVSFGLVSGPLGLGILNVNVTHEGLQIIAELTLAFVLFSDAANADLNVLKRTFRIPERLLLIGLPLTIAAGFVAGVAVFHGMSLLAAALLATMLAPTDAALGKSVVTNERVPPAIRESLSFESGLNDGICVPVLIVFLGLELGMEVEQNSFIHAFRVVIEQLGIGLAVGLGLTGAAAWVLRWSSARGWVTLHWMPIPVVTLTAACYAVANIAGGSGFIACFVGGLLTSAIAKHHKHEILSAAEGTGEVLALLTWAIFGAVVVGQVAAAFTWPVLVYAILSLTIVRVIPVLIALAGTGIGWEGKLFVGWFGPRGLASIVFAIMVYHENLPERGTLGLIVVLTVMLSVVLHGMSANALIAKLGGKLARGLEQKQ